LVAQDGPAAGSRFAVESSPYWIGAAESADLHLAADDYLSAHHASVQYHEGSLLLYDNHSTNGTFVNDARLGEAPRTLAPGDRIRFGRSTFTVVAS
jgi:pSer/pThr/pTyr-binding forkhead associated (FHA) protein